MHGPVFASWLCVVIVCFGINIRIFFLIGLLQDYIEVLKMAIIKQKSTALLAAGN